MLLLTPKLIHRSSEPYALHHQFGKIRCVPSLSLTGRGEVCQRTLGWTLSEFRAELWLCVRPDPFRLKSLNIVVESLPLNRDLKANYDDDGNENVTKQNV